MERLNFKSKVYLHFNHKLYDETKNSIYYIQKNAVAALEKLSHRRGRPRESARINLISKLADIYERITGKKPRKTSPENPSGRFFDFVTRCFRHMGLNKDAEPSTLVPAIRSALDLRKRAKNTSERA